MILITGATGNLGSAVIDNLLKKTPAANIAALVRDEAKGAHLKEMGISVRIGNYDDIASLVAAMQGIDSVLLISGGGQNGLQQHKNVVDAAVQAGVKSIAYTGRALRDRNTLVNPLMVRHFETEDYIRASGLAYTLFRNILYMDVLPGYTGESPWQEGLQLCAGEGKVSYALRSEMGEAMANVLLEDNYANRTYHFTGSELYSFYDVAAALSALAEKPVTYTPISVEAFTARMEAAGKPPFVVQLLSHFLIDIEAGQEMMLAPDLEVALGRKPAGLSQGLKQIFKF